LVEVWKAIDPDQVPALLQTLDVLVNPVVEGARGLSIKVLEAMASGLVVITTFGNPEFGTPGVSYILVKNKAEEFRRAILELLSDSNLLRETSKRAREQASRFSRQIIAGQWRQVLLPLVQKTYHGNSTTRAQFENASVADDS
jgi:glycosyltransferase involved in cell wall biosynthesis